MTEINLNLLVTVSLLDLGVDEQGANVGLGVTLQALALGEELHIRTANSLQTGQGS